MHLRSVPTHTRTHARTQREYLAGTSPDKHTHKSSNTNAASTTALEKNTALAHRFPHVLDGGRDALCQVLKLVFFPVLVFVRPRGAFEGVFFDEGGEVGAPQHLQGLEIAGLCPCRTTSAMCTFAERVSAGTTSVYEPRAQENVGSTRAHAG